MLEISIIKCLSDNFSFIIKDTENNLVGVIDPSEFNVIDYEIQKNHKKF